MFFLCAHAAGVRLLEHPVTGAALSVPPPAIACPSQRPRRSFFGRASANRIGVRWVVVLAGEFGHDRITEEMTLFHPEAMEVADAPADVFPPYWLEPIPL